MWLCNKLPMNIQSSVQFKSSLKTLILQIVEWMDVKQ